jgi:ferredoxin/flavodoxin---NADP+ reductase
VDQARAQRRQAIDAHERRAGEPSGRPRVKLVSVADMLEIAGQRAAS